MSHAFTLSFTATKSNEWTFCGTDSASRASPQPKSAITYSFGLKSNEFRNLFILNCFVCRLIVILNSKN